MVILILIDGTIKVDEDVAALAVLWKVLEKRDWQSVDIITNSESAFNACVFANTWRKCRSVKFDRTLKSQYLGDIREMLLDYLDLFKEGNPIEFNYVYNSFHYHNVTGVNLYHHDILDECGSIGDKITFDYVKTGSDN